MPKVSHSYLLSKKKIVEKPIILRVLGVEKPQINKNLAKLGHYLPFEQKIQKYNFFVEKPKNLYFRGPNPKKLKIPVLLSLMFQIPAIIPPYLGKN